MSRKQSLDRCWYFSSEEWAEFLFNTAVGVGGDADKKKYVLWKTESLYFSPLASRDRRKRAKSRFNIIKRSTVFLNILGNKWNESKGKYCENYRNGKRQY